MASSSSSGPDTIINLKVSFDGVVKKVKLPLRDLAASTLANKVRDTHYLVSPFVQNVIIYGNPDCDEWYNWVVGRLNSITTRGG